MSRSGPLGSLGILFTPSAIIIAQTCLAIPIITGVTVSAISTQFKPVKEMTLSLGGNNWHVMENIFIECKVSITGGLIVAFGQSISEVGASMIVGGNIRYFTRTMTTSIILQTRMGENEMAFALGLILIITSFLLTFILTAIQIRGKKK
ncbi:MAG: ABC transporter permease [Promethearchaeota archaeon]